MDKAETKLVFALVMLFFSSLPLLNSKSRKFQFTEFPVPSNRDHIVGFATFVACRYFLELNSLKPPNPLLLETFLIWLSLWSKKPLHFYFIHSSFLRNKSMSPCYLKGCRTKSDKGCKTTPKTSFVFNLNVCWKDLPQIFLTQCHADA